MRFCTACGRELAAVPPTEDIQKAGATTQLLDTNTAESHTNRTSPVQPQTKTDPIVVEPRRISTFGIVVIAVLTTIVILGGGGIIAWILLGHRQEQKHEAPTIVVVQPTAPSLPNLEPDKAPLPTVIPESPDNRLEAVEKKIVQGVVISDADLSGLSRDDLRILRNVIYARHGRRFNSPELQRYFDRRPWYSPRGDYKDTDLTDNDRKNLSLIQKKEQ